MKEIDKNKPLLNWDVLSELLFRHMGPPPDKNGGAGKKAGPMPGRGIGGWDKQAENYNRMIHMEGRFTLNQVNCFDTDTSDTVLDLGCGPGRISMPMAQRAQAVTSFDASPKMLEFCQANAAAAGITNITTVLGDWENDADVAKLGKHDIVICSRSVALGDIEKMAALARKYVVMVIWANGAPPIPALLGRFFAGTHETEEPRRSPMYMDRRLGNNLFYNRIYDLGYEPNARIVEDGFEKTYASREEAYADLRQLDPTMSDGKMDVFRKNIDQFLTEKDGGIYFLAPTKSIVFWFSPTKSGM